VSSTYGVVDLFAGPGGLGEGFSSVSKEGRNPFRIGISVEKEKSAHRTLQLRSFLREYRRRHGCLPAEYVKFHAGIADEPDWGAVDADAWALARAEARCLELGTPEAARELDRHIDRIHEEHTDTVLIGGPPCQAYSLVGRARVRGVDGYRPEEDNRHFLFREYMRVLDRLRPAAFVLENVKGVLSSKVDGQLIFDEIMRDISTLGGSDAAAYELFALSGSNGRLSLIRPSRPSDFIVRSERFGIPQKRHRVIVIGIRSDVAVHAGKTSIATLWSESALEDAIGALPALRSGLSKIGDDPEAWRQTVIRAAERLKDILNDSADGDLRHELTAVVDTLAKEVPPRSSGELPPKYGRSSSPLLRWIENDELAVIAQHETRGHMTSDLERYLFSSVWGKVRRECVRKSEFPEALAPNHESWSKGIFADRFRTQLGFEPSTTITSHISKDGHYFIHPDPVQCRSLTVREAARLQTFPDDYLFLGNRTQQYVQVGNAVPPLLAHQIAGLLLEVLEPGSRADVATVKRDELQSA